MPETPIDFIDLNKIGHGAMFTGSKGSLVASFEDRVLIPTSVDADLTYYNRRPAEQVLPTMRNFQQEWISACKGNLKTSCDFDYGGKMIEGMLLGLVAYRVGQPIEYDAFNGKVTNSPEADTLLRKTYRKGWSLDG